LQIRGAAGSESGGRYKGVLRGAGKFYAAEIASAGQLRAGGNFRYRHPASNWIRPDGIAAFRRGGWPLKRRRRKKAKKKREGRVVKAAMRDSRFVKGRGATARDGENVLAKV